MRIDHKNKNVEFEGNKDFLDWWNEIWVPFVHGIDEKKYADLVRRKNRAREGGWSVIYEEEMFRRENG